jgi:hypothetical protein
LEVPMDPTNDTTRSWTTRRHGTGCGLRMPIGSGSRSSCGLRMPRVAWAGASLINLMIWVASPWGAMLAVRWLGERGTASASPR